MQENPEPQRLQSGGIFAIIKGSNLEKGCACVEKIASFTINHLDLLPGIYVSRKDKAGEAVLTTLICG